MWVSRKDWEELNKRVDKLEGSTNMYVGDSEWGPWGFPCAKATSTVDVLHAIIKHLGLSFEFDKPEKIVVHQNKHKETTPCINQ